MEKIKQKRSHFWRWMTAFFMTFLFGSADAEVSPGPELSRAVGQRTLDLFDLMVENRFSDERDLFGGELQTMVSEEEWRNFRERINSNIGAPSSYNAHKLTYYQNETLLAAVDFHAEGRRQGTYICGYVIWKIQSLEDMKISRIEQSVVEDSIFEQLPIETAAQTMVSWRCPNQLTETVLGVTLQSN